ncbi:protein TonB [Polaromonas sp. CG_9.7]|nr:protein TonB [Polaromonas sp. CG_9.7]MBG6112793.1 protein TonB [Polaromonas sp. CG_9.2]MDH6186268.1 protein TonB [Polaromonas sp. CG_23.6]
MPSRLPLRPPEAAQMSSAPPMTGTWQRAFMQKPDRRLGKFRSPSTLQVALGISLAAHAALLAVRIVDPERFNRVFQDTPLEVILVNAKSSDTPEANAKAIAQASLAGGGMLDSGRPTSPLPPSVVEKNGDAQEDANEQRQVRSLKEQQKDLLLQTRNELAALPPPDLSVPSSLRAQTEQEEKRRQLVKLLAEIEKSINEDGAQPSRRYISPSTREAVYAVYYDAMRRKIEKKGTLNFPQRAGKKLYGELTMTMTVNADGQVLTTEVVQSSGNPTLDRWAQSLVQGSGPFEPFSEAMRGKADQIVVVSSFNFGRDDSLETKLTDR